MMKKILTRSCVQCHKEMKLGIAILSTNISFLVLADKKIYENDDRLIGVCINPSCPNYGLLSIPMEILQIYENNP